MSDGKTKRNKFVMIKSTGIAQCKLSSNFDEDFVNLAKVLPVQ